MRTGFEVIKVVEMQHLREVKDAAGDAVVDMTMTSEPAIYVPFWGSNVKMGEVVFRVRSEPGASGCMVSRLSGYTAQLPPHCPARQPCRKSLQCIRCHVQRSILPRVLITGMAMLQVHLHLTCSADQFKFLWGIKGHVERIMLQESKRVALSYVDFATKLATCAPGLEAFWDASRKVWHCNVFPLHACAMRALDYLLQHLSVHFRQLCSFPDVLSYPKPQSANQFYRTPDPVTAVYKPQRSSDSYLPSPCRRYCVIDCASGTVRRKQSYLGWT